MRIHFEQQTKIGVELISEVDLSMRSRDQFPQLLAGLQYIFIKPEVNKSVFKLLEEKLMKGKKRTGRPGMSLWEILVLGVVRLNLNMDYDRLHYISNSDQKLRGILGVHSITPDWDLGKEYKLQTLKDNVRLVDEELIKQINELVVGSGHELKKKEERLVGDIKLRLKTDSFAVESNIHFPTDLNLLWDSLRKCFDVLEKLGKEGKVPGFGKLHFWKKEVYKSYRWASNIHRKKGKNYTERLQSSTGLYLKNTVKVLVRIKNAVAALRKKGDLMQEIMLDILEKFYDWGLKHEGLVRRRIMNGEKIPHGEKVFSIFEPHTEWLQKGKAGNKVELGHNVSVTTDQWEFVVDWEVVEKQSDKQLTVALGKRLSGRFDSAYSLESISFDRGYYSLLGEKSLKKTFDRVVMPKPGKKTANRESEESTEEFSTLRRAHSAVESNINELEHSGADKVPDKGINGFKKYVAWSVLAHNLKRLGRLVIEGEVLPTVKSFKLAA